MGDCTHPDCQAIRSALIAAAEARVAFKGLPETASHAEFDGAIACCVMADMVLNELGNGLRLRAMELAK